MLRSPWLALAALVAACAGPPTAPVAPRDHAYVVVGPDGRATARLITASATCPPLIVDGVSRATALRRAAGTIAQRASVTPSALSKSAAFPVTTCELAIPRDARRVVHAGRDLPLPKADPRRIVVLGDTGCRILGPTDAQPCVDPARWPFARVARAAAATNPDLVIHVGDYHYRESPCPPASDGCRGSPWGYGWDSWDADLFTPARPLLEAAPWIVVRGNHEMCTRAGQGWWRFLDPRPLERGRDCDDARDDATGEVGEPYAVPLGGGWRALVFDSASVGNAPIAPDGALFRTYREQMQRLLVQSDTSAWFLSHHPPLAFAANPSRPLSPHLGNAGLLAVLRSLNGEAYFPPHVKMLVSGHNHVFEAVSFASDHPPQLVTGHGGDTLDDPLPSPFPPGLAPAPGTTVAGLVASHRFGYLVADRDGDAWSARAYDVDGATLATCAVTGREMRCASH
jgi:hypothetical protein